VYDVLTIVFMNLTIYF